jgi:hypothetical protein
MFERRYANILKLDSFRESGKKSKGARREHGHDWHTICCDYDTLMSEGRKRSAVTGGLCKKYRINKPDLNRGLRNRERGRNAKKHP